MSGTITKIAVFALLFASTETCMAVPGSGATIDKVKNPKNGAGTYDVTMTGTMTLAVGDTYNGSTAYLTDPNGVVTPMILNVIPPTPGQTVNYTATASGVVGVAGNWKATIDMEYTHNNQTKHSKVTFSPILMP